MKKVFFVLTVMSIVFPKLLFAGEIKLVTIEWPPYVGQTISGNGFIAEVVRAAWRKSGYHIALEFLPLKRALSYTRRGRFTAVFPYVSKESPEKSPFWLSEPFGGTATAFYQRKSDNPIRYKSLEGLKPYTIGVVRGFCYSEEFNKADYLRKDIAGTVKSNFMKLIKKRVDLVIGDKFISDMLFRDELSEVAPQIEQLNPPFSVQPLYLAFSKSVPGARELLMEFNIGLRHIKRDGTLEGIMSKYGVSTISSKALSPSELKDFVNNAAKFIQMVGLEDALDEFKKREGRFSKGELYIFAINMKGDMLAHINPALDGTHQIELKDRFGFPIIQEMIKILETKENGWVEYWWENPITQKIQPKLSYVRKINDNLFIGCGIYR